MTPSCSRPATPNESMFTLHKIIGQLNDFGGRKPVTASPRVHPAAAHGSGAATRRPAEACADNCIPPRRRFIRWSGCIVTVK